MFVFIVYRRKEWTRWSMCSVATKPSISVMWSVLCPSPGTTHLLPLAVVLTLLYLLCPTFSSFSSISFNVYCIVWFLTMVCPLVQVCVEVCCVGVAAVSAINHWYLVRLWVPSEPLLDRHIHGWLSPSCSAFPAAVSVCDCWSGTWSLGLPVGQHFTCIWTGHRCSKGKESYEDLPREGKTAEGTFTDVISCDLFFFFFFSLFSLMTWLYFI